MTLFFLNGTVLAKFECSITRSGPAQAVVSWPAAAGSNYILQSTSEALGPWADVLTDPPVLVGNGASLSQSFAAGSGTRFFRVVRLSLPPGMAYVPAGTFTMGDSLDENYVNEVPVHDVRLSGFYVDKTEVPGGLWASVRDWSAPHGYVLAAGVSKATNHPVHSVSWYEIINWCNARSEKEGLTPVYYQDAAFASVCRTGMTYAPFVQWTANGYRLPTEAEWEKAARGGGSGFRFPWGQTISHDQANYLSHGQAYDVSPTRGYHPLYNDGVVPYTNPVGAFAANGYGLCDVAGNVWEWCWDWYLEQWYRQPGATEDDCRGPAAPTGYHVLRGGTWGESGYNCRCAFRRYFSPNTAGNNYGFRCVRRS